MKRDLTESFTFEEEEETGDVLSWTITEADAGERIDKFVSLAMDEQASRSQVQQWIKEQSLSVNGKTVKANHRLAADDRIELTIPPPEDAEIAAEPIELDVVYEDSDVIVVNKPRGMVVHPAPGHASGTLVNALLHHCRDLSGINGVMRPGIVHRIDKDTSGLIMAAKNDEAHNKLSLQLKEHTVTRTYLAVVHGVVQHDQGTVDAPIGRDPKDRKLFTVTERNSKHAVTHFHVLERFKDYTFLECKLETGRTHQIRVHMQFIGHSLVGDPQYGKTKGDNKAFTGQALHAAVLGFIHPQKADYLEFSAALPDDMNQLLNLLRAL